MIVAKIQVTDNIAHTVYRKVITAGIIGAQVEFEYADDIWNGLRKTVVFRGSVTKDVVTDENIVTIPQEVAEKPLSTLSVGVYGVDVDGNLAIPTIWAVLGTVRAAANPSGDTTTDSSLPIWAQIQGTIGNLEDLDTDAKNNLVAAVNETMTKGGVVSSVNGKTGAVVLTAGDVHAMPDNTVIPTVPKKVSAFENDAGYLTEHQNISGKVDKVAGKGLSTNDYDNAAKAKVDAIPDDPKYTDTVYDDTEVIENINQLKGEIADCIKSPASAEVGQIVKIAAVDDAGKPTAWEAVDLPEQVQPDWNQNDDTATDFVKNRPFYSETRNITVENAVDEILKGFPVFSVGDTVTVNVDGVEYSLVAYDDEGCVTIGDTFRSFENGEGQLGWKIYFVPGYNEVGFHATESRTVSYLGIVTHKIDDKFVNFGGFVRTFDYHFKNYSLYKTLYNDAGNGCILYTCSDIIFPEATSILFGFMSEAGFSKVGSTLKHSCFVSAYVINDIGNINIIHVVLGTDTAEMVQNAERYGYTHTTNPKA